MICNCKRVARAIFAAGAVLSALLIGGCAQRAAPVVERGLPAGSLPAPSVAPPAAATTPAPLVREAKDGIYTVQRGDTLFSIAAAFGVDHRDLASWNNIADGSSITIGQSLQVAPPATAAAVTPVAPSGSTEVRPLPPSGPVATIPAPPSAVQPEVPPAGTAPPAPVEPPPTAEIGKPEAAPPPKPSAVQFQWPAPGKVIGTFDDPRNKGIDIAGAEGAPVQAAADGEVVYVGSAVRGYGNLVIVRHGDDYITAYAHNRKILVQEKQQVKRGQTIAEVGRTDTTSPRLHFEIRHQGKPVDPLKHLPPR